MLQCHSSPKIYRNQNIIIFLGAPFSIFPAHKEKLIGRWEPIYAIAFYARMKVTQYKSAEVFLDNNLAFLEAQEAANNLILDLAFGMQKGKYPMEGSLLFSVIDGKQILFSALQTPGRNLTIF